MNQMLLTLLGIILFLTIYLTAFNALSDQYYFLQRSAILTQGVRIANRFLQKVDAENKSINDFSEIYNNYHSGLSDTLNVNDIEYYVDITSNYCDEDGNIFDPQPADHDLQRVDVRMWCKRSETDTLYIGTLSDPFPDVPKILFKSGI